MTARNDINNPQFIVAATLPATGTLVQIVGTGMPGFSYFECLGLNNISITAQTVTGSTAVGTLTLQCTDIKTDRDGLYDPAIPWATMNYPGTSTPVTIALATGANAYNVQIMNIGCKYIRLVYTATSGTGTLNVGITGRANSRT